MPSSIAPLDPSARRAIRGAWALIGATPVLMAAATWRYGPIDPWLAWMRFIAPPVLVAEIVLIAAAWRHGARLGQPLAWLILVGVALLLVVANGVVIASDPWMAEIRAGVTLIHVAAGIAAASLAARTGPGGTAPLWQAIALGGLGYSLAAGAYVALVPDWATHDWQRFGLGVTNIRHAAFYAAAGAAGSIALAGPGRRALWLAAALPPATLILWSGSRGGMVALLVGSLAAAALLRRSWLRLPLSTAAILGVAALSAGLLPTPVSSAPARIEQSVALGADASSGRIAMWSGTMTEIARRPLLGHGEGQYIMTPPGQGIFHHPHQAVLQLLFQWGAIGTALVIVLLGATLRRSYGSVMAAPDALRPGVMMLATFAVYMLYDGIIFFVFPSMLVAVALGTLAGAAGVASRPHDRYLHSR